MNDTPLFILIKVCRKRLKYLISSENITWLFLRGQPKGPCLEISESVEIYDWTGCCLAGRQFITAAAQLAACRGEARICWNCQNLLELLEFARICMRKQADQPPQSVHHTEHLDFKDSYHQKPTRRSQCLSILDTPSIQILLIRETIVRKIKYFCEIIS